MSLKGKFVHVEVTDVGKVQRPQRGRARLAARHRLVGARRRHGRLQRRRGRERHRRENHHRSRHQACKRPEKRNEIEAGTGYMRQTIVLRDAIHRANKVINQTAQSQPQCEGMGTTLVASLFYDNRVSIAHVGDSRMYRLRGNRFEQITMDHSLLQELVDRGFYSPRGSAALDEPQLRHARARRRGERRRRGARGRGAERRLFPDVLGRPARHGRGRGHPSHDQHVQQRRAHGRRATRSSSPTTTAAATTSPSSSCASQTRSRPRPEFSASSAACSAS